MLKRLRSIAIIVLNCLYMASYPLPSIRGCKRSITILMIYEGLKQTNEKTRIEALMHQAK